MQRALLRPLRTAPAAFARSLPRVVAAGAAIAGLIAIAAGMWEIYRPAGMITLGLELLVCAAGWYAGGSR